MKKIPDIVTAINLLFQIVYLTFGSYTDDELGNFHLIFYIFRPEYLVFSGIIALINIVILIAIETVRKKIHIYDALMILFNAEYIVFYIWLLGMQ